MPASGAVVGPAVIRTSGALRPRRRCDALLGVLRSLSVSSGSSTSYNCKPRTVNSLPAPAADLPPRTSPLLVRLASPRGGTTTQGMYSSECRKISMRRWSSTTDLSQSATTTNRSPTGKEKAIASKGNTPVPTHSGGGSGRSTSSGLRRPKVRQTNIRPSLAPLFRLSAEPEADAARATEGGSPVPPADDGMDHVLEAVALECDLVLSQYRRASDATKDEVLWAAMGCLLDVSRRPRLREVLAKSHGRGGQLSTSKLRIHRAFITLLSAAANVVSNTKMDAEAQEGDSTKGHDKTPIEQAMQLARQAHRLDLPLPLPLYQQLAQMALSADAYEDDCEVSFVTMSGTSSGSRLSIAASLLLEIADWQVSGGVERPLPAFDSVEGLDSSEETTDAATAQQGTVAKLRFLVPILQRMIERRRYGVVLETISALLIRGGDRHEPSQVADFDTLFALMMAARQGVVSSPANVMEIRQILELLEPSVEEMISSNKALLRSHPHVRNFLHRYFMSDMDDEFDDDAGVDDAYEVWDPVVADLLKPRGGSSNGSHVAFEDRIAAASDFYAAMDAAVDAKLIEISRIHQFPTFASSPDADADASSSSSSDDDNDEEEEGNGDESDWSSDSDGEAEGVSVLKFPGGDATEIAIRRHHMYVRGRGRALDAGYLPDVTAQVIHLHNGLNFRYTDEYENWLWKRDFQDDDDDDDDLSLLTLHDSDNDPFSSGDDDDDDDHSR